MNLEDLKKKYPRLEDRLSRHEKTAKIAELLIDLGDHAGMKILVKELENIVISINAKLLSNDRLETEKREVLQADKERCLWLINMFPQQETILKKIEEYVKKL